MTKWWKRASALLVKSWPRDDRGDVPGWVLVTLMTAGIVMALWIVAEPKLAGLLSSALNIAGDPNGK